MPRTAHASRQTEMSLTFRAHRDCSPRWGCLTHRECSCQASGMRDERPLDEKLAPQELVRDYVWAARAVFNQPSVAFVSVALWCLPTVLAHVLPRHGYARAFVYLGALLFMCGWSGVERTFFLARRDGHEVTLPRLLGSI